MTGTLPELFDALAKMAIALRLEPLQVYDTLQGMVEKKERSEVRAGLIREWRRRKHEFVWYFDERWARSEEVKCKVEVMG